ncbi:hypothetical protein AL755_06130 [Arthrobacter sp. ERGS1:01]|uniref:polysaccharide biosynthesis tyrosine autokinase n=1 Tax=Arthrobacter sp. ERGS1:01 TaxID=1704044 RepID=UPI0006B627B3|nr:polysaccharide biosynthesis tyrosine autokinase [Arthrobacter sp. ERGS1:01]ALE05155.1 hypothetical protein AL755_06130 [Arthrobacter sp. ERGS1:01]
MELSDYLGTVRRYAIVIVVIAFLGASAGFALARHTTPMYKATSSIFVAAAGGENITDLVQGSTFTQNLIQSYAALAQMPSVLQPVITKLGLDETPAELAKSVSADAPLNTVIIDITVVDESPETAAKVANAVSVSLATVAQSLSPKRSDSTPAVLMTPIATASVPVAAFSPNTKLLVIIWGAGALILAIGFVLGRRVVENTIRSEHDLKRSGTVPLLGSVPDIRGLGTPESVAQMVVSGQHADAFRRLADHVVNAKAEGPVRSAVVTSMNVNDGKTLVALGLAVALSEHARRVLLIDADLRQGRASAACGLGKRPGLGEVLTGSATIAGLTRRWDVIDVLPAGRSTAKSSKLLNSPAMEGLMEHLLAEYDFVICDSAAVLPVADTFPLTRLTDGAVVVARAGKSRRDDVHETLCSIEAVKGQVLGTVLNRSGAKLFKIRGRVGGANRAPKHTTEVREAPAKTSAAAAAAAKQVTARK